MKNCLFIILIIWLFLPIKGFPQEPTRWRGPNQNGYYPYEGLLEKWPADGPDILWTYENLGIGFSSPSFANGKIYLTGMEESTGYVYALTDDGKLVWKVPYGGEWESSYPGTRSTPVIAGDRLYMLSGMGDLTCLDANSGITIWNKQVLEEFGGRNAEWGLVETMVIHGDKIICTPGGRTHNIIALNRFNGNVVWSQKAKGEISAYCTPLLVNLNSRNLLVTHTADNIIGVDVDNGQLLWTYGHTNRYSVHPNTPLYYEGQLFCFSGYGQGGVMLELNPDGSNISRKWISKTMDSRIGGAVVFNGKIYGSGDTNREWQCIDWKTGNVDYSTKEIGNGTVIAAEGLLYWYSQRGELALVKPGPSAFNIVSETRVSKGSGQHWAHPVINNGRLFIRHGNALIAYNIRK